MTSRTATAEGTVAIGTVAQSFLKIIVMPGADTVGSPHSETALTVQGTPAPATAANFHHSSRVILWAILATIVVSALAIVILATLAPQSFQAGA